MVPGNDDSTSPFGTSMTMEEIELESGEVAPRADLDKTLAEGDDVPEAYRGKSVSDIIKIAEAARTQMNDSVNSARTAAEAARVAAEALGSRREEAPKPEAPKDMSRDELKALYDEDPLAAIQVIEDQAMRRVAQHVEDRIAPLTSGTVSQAENWARQEFPDEFELFGDKIQGMVDSIPNKQVFSSKKGWEDAVAYIRGQKGNFEKLIDHRANNDNREEASSARTRERDNAGFTGKTSVSSHRRESSSSANSGMGDDEKRIAQRFIDDGTFKDMAEYIRWQKMGA